MAQAGGLTNPFPTLVRAVTAVRGVLLIGMAMLWEALARSGWFYRDVIPSLEHLARALAVVLADPVFYSNLATTVYEILAGLAIGGLCGLATGILLGASPLLSKAYERYFYYLGPTPKIIFFPVLIMWFGIGPGSKIAMGAISCFFPIALSVAGGMRQIDRVLIKVGRSFRANTWQMVTKIYLPAMRFPVLNGVRLGLGVAFIGTLLAETKLSNRGIGFLITQAYSTFNMTRLYALLIALFAIAIVLNSLIGRLAKAQSVRSG